MDSREGGSPELLPAQLKQSCKILSDRRTDSQNQENRLLLSLCGRWQTSVQPIGASKGRGQSVHQESLVGSPIHSSGHGQLNLGAKGESHLRHLPTSRLSWGLVGGWE